MPKGNFSFQSKMQSHQLLGVTFTLAGLLVYIAMVLLFFQYGGIFITPSFDKDVWFLKYLGSKTD